MNTYDKVLADRLHRTAMAAHDRLRRYVRLFVNPQLPIDVDISGMIKLLQQEVTQAEDAWVEEEKKNDYHRQDKW